MGRFVLRRTLAPPPVPVASPTPEKRSNPGARKPPEETAAEAFVRLFPEFFANPGPLGPVAPLPVRLDSLTAGRRFAIPGLQPDRVYTFLRRTSDGMCTVWLESIDSVIDMDGLRAVEYRDMNPSIVSYRDLRTSDRFYLICSPTQRIRNTVYEKRSRYMAVSSRGVGMQVPETTVVRRAP